VLSRALPKTILFNNLREMSYNNVYQNWLTAAYEISKTAFEDPKNSPPEIVKNCVEFWAKIVNYRNYPDTNPFCKKLLEKGKRLADVYYKKNKKWFLEEIRADDLELFSDYSEKLKTCSENCVKLYMNDWVWFVGEKIYKKVRKLQNKNLLLGENSLLLKKFIWYAGCFNA
jgi:hypothetical protein